MHLLSQRRATMMCAVITALTLSTAIGQTSPTPSASVPDWQKAAGGKMEFDVASVRPSIPGTPYATNIPLDGMEGPPPGNLFSANAILMPYLEFAYKINDPVQARALWDKLPVWSRDQFFKVDARADGKPTRDQVRLMVQAMLADRFKLAIHREMRTREQFTLVQEKPGTLGPQIHTHDASKPCVTEASRPYMIPAPAKGVTPPRYCGLLLWNDDGQRYVQIIDVTMAQIANLLSGQAMTSSTTMTPHAAIDATGLSGSFDLDLHFNAVQSGQEESLGSGPTFSAALKNQLGLKMVEGKGQAEIFVIDHIEKPSTN